MKLLGTENSSPFIASFNGIVQIHWSIISESEKKARIRFRSRLQDNVRISSFFGLQLQLFGLMIHWNLLPQLG
jgi:hypothetical protein